MLMSCILISVFMQPLSEKEAIDGWLELIDKDGFGWPVRNGWMTAEGGWRAGKNCTARHGAVMGPCKAEVRMKALGDTASLALRWIATDGKVQVLEAPINAKAGAESKWEPDLSRVTPGSLELAATDLVVTSVRILPAVKERLINGKDLSGWTIFPDKKSRYSIAAGGWLHVEDGPGDIQSDFQAADFVARLTLRTNGKHLNSGLFFRAIPGQFTQAYEAQIRNQFTPGESREYKVDRFDPATGAPWAPIVFRSEAVDFGTGSIYRRVPARSQTASDGSWFTMTVAAHGRRFATWVNGIQQVDWIDNRPANDNPRQGYRAAKGAFSLQGHDPTTNIDFRSLDIQVLDSSTRR
jgi:hypothetical protein